MFDFDKINVRFSVDWYYLLIFAVLVFFYAFYIYKNTLPVVSGLKRWFLISLRTLILILLAVLIFEPVISVKKNITVRPVNLVFVDNSQSIVSKDSLQRARRIKNFISRLADLDEKPLIFSFGQSAREIPIDSLQKLYFNEPATNFSLIYKTFNDFEKPVASVTVISDGIINEGENPLNKFEKLNVPFFVLGTGDTTTPKDIAISKVLYNSYIYQKKPTTIKVIVSNKNFGKTKAAITLKENSKIVSKKIIDFENSGIKNIEFEYTPQNAGERKITVEVSKLKSEDNYGNNRKIVYIKVLKSKIKVLVVSSSPSPDVSFVINGLKRNTDLEVNKLIKIARNKFLPSGNNFSLIDSSDVMFLTGFPGKFTPASLMNKISSAILNDKKPYFISLSGAIDFDKLKSLDDILNFNIVNSSDKYLTGQIQIVDENNPLFKHSSANYIKTWNSLPPVNITQSDIKPKPGAKVLANVKINNIELDKPFLISQVKGSNKSISLLGKNFWKWKLQIPDKNIPLFENFLSNAVKWLRTDLKNKLFKIKTNKKLYAQGEKVTFSAQLYDETLTPVDNADISVKIRINGNETDLRLNSLGNGLYEGSFEPSGSGDYSFSATAKIDNQIMGKASGLFNVGELNPELTNTKLNSEYLKLLANTTGGKYFYLTDETNINDLLENIRENNLIYKTEIKEIKIWSNYWILISLILLFAFEWLIRKITGML